MIKTKGVRQFAGVTGITTGRVRGLALARLFVFVVCMSGIISAWVSEAPRTVQPLTMRDGIIIHKSTNRADRCRFCNPGGVRLRQVVWLLAIYRLSLGSIAGLFWRS